MTMAKLTKAQEKVVETLMKKYGHSRELAIDQIHHWS